jgi:lipopolysaccharide export system permease protein
MLLKTLDKLVLKSFVGPYVFSFFVAEFVLVMQFLWKYVDELVGKGLSFWFLAELVFYYAVTIIPLAVPITILISSVMVYGNMAEKYEISSFKSAGVSLIRVMRPGIFLALFTFAFSLFSSNYLKPKANLKFFQAFENVRKQKPSMTIEEGIFNDDFRGFSIRVGKKHADDESIEDVMIYDNTNRSFLNLTTAKRGKMYTINNGKYFIMELEDVQQYQEVLDKDQANRNNPTIFLRSEFDTWQKIFDMSEFEFSEKTSGLARRKYDLYNTFQLIGGIDSIENDLILTSYRSKYDFKELGIIEIDSTAYKEVVEKQDKDILKTSAISKRGYSTTTRVSEPSTGSQRKVPMTRADSSAVVKSETSSGLNKGKPLPPKNGDNLAKLNKKLDAVKPPEKRLIDVQAQKERENRVVFRDDVDIDTVSTIASLLPEKHASSTVFRALNLAQTINEKIKSASNEDRMKGTNKRRYVLRLHQMYSWATICIIFMFIGAPLGSIVRKGGYGYPLLIAIVFFMLFIILMIMGEKLNKSESISAIMAAWLPCLTLLPISVVLSYLALGDIGGFSFNWLTDFISRFKKEE